MALEVEDGTGKSNADTYVSVADFRTYAAGRGIEAVGDLDDGQCEAALRKAFDKTNTAYERWKSVPVSQTQSGEFPRTNLSDGMGRVTSGVPKRVKDAQCEYAILAGGGVDLFAVAERGGQVASEAVGPISTSYFQGAPAETYFEAASKLLCVFARDPAHPRSPQPSFNDYSTDPLFSVGMDDNTSGSG